MNDGLREYERPAGILVAGLLYLAVYLGLAWLYQRAFVAVIGDAIDWSSEEGQQLIQGTEYLTALYWGCGACCLAVWRVWARHPFYRPGYLRWLRSTPWRPGMPLPKGSPMPGWVEAVLIVASIICLVWVLPWLTIAWLVAAYATAFTLLAGLPYVVYSRQQIWYPVWMVLNLAGLLVIFYQSAWVIALTSAVIFAVACYSLQESLRGLPSYKDKGDGLTGGEVNLPGIPLSGVEPKPIGKPTTRGQAVLISLLAASWIGIAQHLFDATAVALLLTCVFIVTASLARLTSYTSGHRPPITLVQRIKTRRYILAKYDTVYIGPAAGLLTGLLVLLVGYALSLDAPIITALSVFGCLLVLLTVGPSRQHWRLTGGHRVVTQATEMIVTS